MNCAESEAMLCPALPLQVQASRRGAAGRICLPRGCLRRSSSAWMKRLNYSERRRVKLTEDLSVLCWRRKKQGELEAVSLAAVAGRISFCLHSTTTAAEVLFQSLRR